MIPDPHRFPQKPVAIDYKEVVHAFGPGPPGVFPAAWTQNEARDALEKLGLSESTNYDHDPIAPIAFRFVKAIYDGLGRQGMSDWREKLSEGCAMAFMAFMAFLVVLTFVLCMLGLTG